MFGDERKQIFDQVKGISENTYNNYARNNIDITLRYLTYCWPIGNYGNYHFHFRFIRNEYRWMWCDIWIESNVIVHFRIEDISCYLCSHFYKTLRKGKNSDYHVPFLKDTETNKMIIYCNNCKKNFRAFFSLIPLNKKIF